MREGTRKELSEFFAGRALMWVLVALLSGGVGAAIVFEVQPLLLIAPLGITLIIGALGSYFMCPLVLYVLATFFDDIGFVQADTAAKWLGIVCGACLIARTLTARVWNSPPRSARLLAAFAWWGFLTMFWSIRPGYSQLAAMTLLELAALTLLFVVAPLSDREVRVLRGSIVVGGVAVAAVSLAHFFHSLGGDFTARLGIDPQLGKVANPNSLALSLFLPMSLALVGVLTDRSQRSVWPYLAIAVMMLAVLLTQSRGAYLGVMVLWLLVFGSVRRLHVGTIMAILGVVGIVMWQGLPILVARFTDERFWTGSGRTDIWETGLEALKVYWPTGSGIGTFASAYNAAAPFAGARYVHAGDMDAHNIYLQMGVELGLVGLLLFLGMVVTLFRELRRADRRRESPVSPVLLRAALLGLLVGALFTGVIRAKFFWLTLSLSMLTVARREVKATTAQEQAVATSAKRKGLAPSAELDAESARGSGGSTDRATV